MCCHIAALHSPQKDVAIETNSRPQMYTNHTSLDIFMIMLWIGIEDDGSL